jgi:hypothetical protein
MTSGLKEIMDTQEAAAFIGISPRTLEGKRLDGSGPKYIKLGNSKRSKVLYRRHDVEAWLEGFARTKHGA